MSLTNPVCHLVKQPFKIAKGKVKIKYVEVKNYVLKMFLNIKGAELKYDLVLINETEEDYYKIPINSVDDKLEINLLGLLKATYLTGKWSFCLQSTCADYTLIENITLNNEKNMPYTIIDLDVEKSDRDHYISGIYVDENGYLIFCQMPSLFYKKTTRYPIEEKMTIKNLIINKIYSEFELDREGLIPEAILELVFTLRKKGERVILPIKQIGEKFRVEIKEQILSDLMSGRWDISLEILSERYFTYGRVTLSDAFDDSKKLRYLALENNESILLYQTVNNNLSLLKGKSENVFRESNQTDTQLTKLKKINKNTYFFKISMNSPKRVKIINIQLKLRNPDTYKMINLQNVKIKKNKKNKYKAEGILKFDWNDFSSLYWDLQIKVKDHTGQVGYYRVNKASPFLISKFNKNYFKQAIYTEDKIIYPYVTLNNSIAFVMREKEFYEKPKYQFKKAFAYFIYKVLKKPYFDKRHLWLGFEKFSKTAQDNGFAFFSYVSKENLYSNFYYIIDKSSPDYERIKESNINIITFMSFKYMLYLFAADLLISSETKRHAYNIRIRADRLAHSLDKKKSVFLQHGVTGLKVSDVFRNTPRRGNFDLVIATSDVEKEIITEKWGYTEENVAVTGFSRWDLLEDKSAQMTKKKIFVMPTWRSWIEGLSKQEFVKTDYYKNYVSLLTSEKLNEILEKNNLELVFFLHPKFMEYINEFKVDNKNIKLKGFLDIKVNEEIMESSLLISDYSSVTWDMFYLKKPVIFFQFDRSKYEKLEGSYLNLKTELFGDTAISNEEVLELIQEYILNDFSTKQRFDKLHKKYFKYNDQSNSERIFEVISNKFYKKVK